MGDVNDGIEATHRPPPPTTLLYAPTPEGAFALWIFVNQWNAFIYVAARDVALDWSPPPAEDRVWQGDGMPLR